MVIEASALAVPAAGWPRGRETVIELVPLPQRRESVGDLGPQPMTRLRATTHGTDLKRTGGRVADRLRGRRVE